MTAGDLQERLVANVRPTLLILSAAVGFVLLIACANVASLLLSRAVARRKEFAVRSALGAPRLALIRQVLVESILMALASGALGILLGRAGTKVLVAFMQSNLPQLADVPMDLRVLAFALAISVLSGILFGIAPSFQLSRSGLAVTLCNEGRGSAGSRRRNRARSMIVTAQVALSMILLIGSGLLIRSFARLRTVNPGFDATSLLTAQTFLPITSYAQASQRVAFYQDALQRLQSIPAVESAAISTALPVFPNHAAPARFEGQAEVDLGRRPIVLMESISPDYAKTMRVPMLEGRPFNDFDGAKATPVVLVNRALVRKFSPNEDPIGKLLWLGTLPPFKVVGVLGDDKTRVLPTHRNPRFSSHTPSFLPRRCI
jgi:putative ABC transport system permease protein